MNRFRMGAAILALLVVLSCIVTLTVRHETDKLLSSLDLLEAAAVTDSLEAAEEPFQAFEKQWEKSEKLLHLMVWRSKLQEIDKVAAHLDPMRAADCDELMAELAEVRMWILRLRSSEMPTWNNIL